MTSAKVLSQNGKDVGVVELPEELFGVEPNLAVMHQVVTAQLAARRRGTHSTKTRSERRGGGAKPWRQKGLGRARQGSIRAPQWRKGGVVHGPKPRSYRQRTPKKMKRLALASALSDRARENRVIVVDEWHFGEKPSTKKAIEALRSLGIGDEKTLVVLSRQDRVTGLSFRNLPNVHLILPEELNAFDVLRSEYVVFTRSTLPGQAGLPSRADRRAEEATVEEAAGQGEPGGEPATSQVEGGSATQATADAMKKVVKKRVVKKVVKKVVKRRPPQVDSAGASPSQERPDVGEEDSS